MAFIFGFCAPAQKPGNGFMDTMRSAEPPGISIIPLMGETAIRASRGMRIALFVIGFGSYLNLNAVQPLLPLFRRVFDASEIQVSLTVSASALAVALTAPLAGVVADRLGRKRVIVTSMLGVALATALAATARTLPQLIGWRFLQGIFVPGVAAVAMAYVSEEAPAEAAGQTMAAYVTGTVIGGFAGRFLNGLVAPYWGWRTAFVFLGAATFLSASGTGWRLPRSKKFVPQRAGIASVKTLGKHLRNRQLLATYVIGAAVLLSQVSTFTYVNFYLADPPFRLGPTALSMIFAVYLLGAAVTPAAGRLVDRLGDRTVLLGAAGLGGLGILVTLLPVLAAVIAGLSLLAAGAFICQAAAQKHVGTVAGDARSSAAGLYISLFYVGGTLGSVIPGLFWDLTGWPGCVAFVLAVHLLTAGIAHRYWVPSPVEPSLRSAEAGKA
jgi:MFS transporter, YNFM family, putative membrane transport protein